EITSLDIGDAEVWDLNELGVILLLGVFGDPSHDIRDLTEPRPFPAFWEGRELSVDRSDVRERGRTSSSPVGAGQVVGDGSFAQARQLRAALDQPAVTRVEAGEVVFEDVD